MGDRRIVLWSFMYVYSDIIPFEVLILLTYSAPPLRSSTSSQSISSSIPPNNVSFRRGNNHSFSAGGGVRSPLASNFPQTSGNYIPPQQATPQQPFGSFHPPEQPSSDLVHFPRHGSLEGLPQLRDRKPPPRSRTVDDIHAPEHFPSPPGTAKSFSPTTKMYPLPPDTSGVIVNGVIQQQQQPPQGSGINMRVEDLFNRDLAESMVPPTLRSDSTSAKARFGMIIVSPSCTF
jgi:hypothetical protein